MHRRNLQTATTAIDTFFRKARARSRSAVLQGDSSSRGFSLDRSCRWCRGPAGFPPARVTGPDVLPLRRHGPPWSFTAPPLFDAAIVAVAIAARESLGDNAARRDAPREPHVAPDHRAAADRDPSEDRGIGVDDHVVLHDRMAGRALLDPALVIHAEALRSQRHAVVQPHIRADPCRLADHHAGTVVREQSLPDRAAGMDVDVGERAGDLGDDPRHSRGAELVRFVCHAMVQDRSHAWENLRTR